MGRDLLESLFYDGIMPQEECVPQKSEYWDYMKYCDQEEKELLELLPPVAQAKFDDYKGYAQKLTTLENEEHFIQGLAFGIRLSGEAFTLGMIKKEE